MNLPTSRMHPKQIDSHHHFWRYHPVEYDWIDERMQAIRRDFGPEDLRAEIKLAGIDGVVSVQARQSLEETTALLRFARDNEFIRGVVGWAPLIEPDVAERLAEVAAPKLRAIRHVLQGEADDYMLRADFNAGVRELTRLNLAYDLLIVERQLPPAIQFVDRHPNQVFILDHIAKPRIREGRFEPWATQIRKLARRENVYCKISGMVTEADWAAWTSAQLQPYADTVLEAFGPARTMFGSDWPVCLVASSYGNWVNVVQSFIAEFSADEQGQIMGGTAMRAYQLRPVR